MSIAGPVDEPSAPAEGAKSPISRRTVLGAAVAGGAGVAALRVLVYPRVEELLQHATGTVGGKSDWISPLGSQKARVAHLLRRATFGASLEELDRAASDGFSKTIDRLLESRPVQPPAPSSTGDVVNDRRL